MIKESKDLVKEPQKLPAVGGELGRGHETPVDQEDMEIPRARLIQSTSEEATADKQEDRVAIGTIINSLTKKKLSPNFIPIIHYPNSYIQWNPRKKDDPNFDPAFDLGAMVFSTTDANDPRVIQGKNFGPNGEAPKVTKYINYLVYFPGENMPVLLSFYKTSANAGKRLNSLTRFVGGDIFANQFTLRAVQKEQAGTKYFAFDVAPAGKASAEDFKTAELFYNAFKSKSVTIHPTNEEDAFTTGTKKTEQFEE